MFPTVVVPDAYFHVYLSTDNACRLAAEDTAYQQVLKTYQAEIGAYADTYAYCLLPTHFHFFIRTHAVSEQIATWYGDTAASPGPFAPCDFVNAFSNLAGVYGASTSTALRYVPVRHRSNFTHLVRYIHQNPVLHQLDVPFQTWRWSSYQAILRKHAQTAIDVKTVLRWFHGVDWFEETHWEPVEETKIGYLILDD